MSLNPKKPRTAFTLIELLAALAVIAILAAILIPAVSRVRDRAAGAKSVSNLRQIGTAMQMFANDNGGELPHWVVGETPTWYHRISEDGRYGLPEGGGTDAYSPVLYSPLSGKDGGGGWPAHNPDYGINLAVVNDSGAGGGIRPRKLNSITQPAKLLLMVGTGSPSGATEGDFRFNPRWENQLAGGPKRLAENYSGFGWMAFRYPPPRGAKGDMTASSAAALFCDFHAEMIPFDDPRLHDPERRRELFLPE